MSAKSYSSHVTNYQNHATKNSSSPWRESSGEQGWPILLTTIFYRRLQVWKHLKQVWYFISCRKELYTLGAHSGRKLKHKYKVKYKKTREKNKISELDNGRSKSCLLFFINNLQTQSTVLLQSIWKSNTQKDSIWAAYIPSWGIKVQPGGS